MESYTDELKMNSLADTILRFVEDLQYLDSIENTIRCMSNEDLAGMIDAATQELLRRMING